MKKIILYLGENIKEKRVIKMANEITGSKYISIEKVSTEPLSFSSQPSSLNNSTIIPKGSTNRGVKDIFLIGTGFEADYNQPMMAHFPNDLESLNKGGQSFFENFKDYLDSTEKRLLFEDIELEKDICLYLSIIRNFNIKTQENIEEILDFAHKYLKPELRRIFFILFYYVFLLRELGFYLGKKYREGGNKLLGYYSRILQERNVIITTNYTSFAEKEHHKLKKDSKEGIAFLEGKYLGIENPDYPLILKLHGGIFYSKENKNITIFTDTNKQFIEYYSFKNTRGEFGEDIYDKTYNQIIIPPIKDKDILFGDERYKILEDVWGCGEKEIKNIKMGDRFFAIGYSFQCEDTKLFELLKNVKNEAVYIILPHKPEDAIIEKIGKIFCNAKKITWVGMYANDFIEGYPNNIDNFLIRYPHVEILSINK